MNVSTADQFDYTLFEQMLEEAAKEYVDAHPEWDIDKILQIVGVNQAFALGVNMIYPVKMLKDGAWKIKSYQSYLSEGPLFPSYTREEQEDLVKARGLNVPATGNISFTSEKIQQIAKNLLAKRASESRQQEKAAKEQELKSLSDRCGLLQSEAENLKKQLEEFKCKNTSLTAKCKSLEEEVLGLKRKNETLELSLKTKEEISESDRAGFSASIERINKTWENSVKDIHSQYEKEIDQLKNRYEQQLAEQEKQHINDMIGLEKK